MQTLTLTKPDDLHLHLRDGKQLASVVNYTAKRFKRAIIMPNLNPPITTVAQASSYRERILAGVEPQFNFEPLMTLYLTEKMSAADIHDAKASGLIKGVKYYPAKATTNAEFGVADLTQCYPTIEAMMQKGLPLLIHGEVTDDNVDIFDREAVFIDKVLAPLAAEFSELNIVLEHITTSTAVDFVTAASAHIAATITPQHLLLNRNALFKGGLQPHHYCLPILKAEADRKALVTAATSGNPKFFLGTDSAPHGRSDKESACGCAGIFSAHIALELYAEVFEAAGHLDKLEAFASHHGANFYGLAPNKTTITLIKKTQTVPETLAFDDDVLVPFRANESCLWQIKQ